MIKLLISFLLVNLLLLAVEIDYTNIESRQVYLTGKNEVRFSETIAIPTNETDVIVNNFPKNIDINTLLYDTERVESVAYSVEDTDNLVGTIAIYEEERYEILSLTPLMIKNINDGRVLINPDSQLEIPAIGTGNKNAAKFRLKEGVPTLELDYSHTGISWEKIYTLDLSSSKAEKNLILKNNSKVSLDNIDFLMDDGTSQRINLMEDSENIFHMNKTSIHCSEVLFYNTSAKTSNPIIEVDFSGVDIPEGMKVSIVDNEYYLGSNFARKTNDRTIVTDIRDSRVHISKREDIVDIGANLEKNNREYLIKNYRKESIKLIITYDKLPEKWYEINAQERYTVTDNNLEFSVEVPPNSRKTLIFSYVSEKK